MEIYFLRHGPAGSRDAWEGDDAERPLTDKGGEMTARVAERLAEAGVSIDVVVSSPYVRARQTADIAVHALGVARPLETDDALRPGFGFADLAAVLQRHGPADTLMLVGHEPDFSTTIGRMIGGADIALKRAGVAMVEVTDVSTPEGTLRWLAPPSLLV
jgi:phosphohistidine phosphatase